MTRVCMLVTNRGYDDPRVCMEAEALVRAGHDVTVVGWDREIDQDAQQTQNGVQFKRLALRSTHARGLTQIYYLGRFWLRCLPVVKELSPDVIHCHDLDSLPAGYRASRSTGAKLIFDAHENFPDMMDGHLPGPAVKILRWLEAKLVSRVDLLITVGPRLADFYRQLGAKDVQVVGNWKNAADYTFEAEQVSRARKELGIADDVIAISYIANLGRDRRIQPLLNAVVADKRFACVFGGSGAQAELVSNAADAHENIVFLGHVPPAEVPLITAACDVIYYGFDESNPNARWSAPNKLYEAIAVGKPILGGDFGEIGDTITTHGCGLIANTDTAETLGPTLEKLAAPGVLAELGEKARAIQTVYSRDRACEAVTRSYESLCGKDVDAR